MVNRLLNQRGARAITEGQCFYACILGFRVLRDINQKPGEGPQSAPGAFVWPGCSINHCKADGMIGEQFYKPDDDRGKIAIENAEANRKS